MGAVELPAGVTLAQVMISWLLRRSPTVLAIPGISSEAHLEENMAAPGVELPDSVWAELEKGAD